MSVKSFGEFCQLLSKGKWSQNDKDSIKLTAKKRPDYLTRKLAEDFCVICIEYRNGKYCGKCDQVNSISYYIKPYKLRLVFHGAMIAATFY